MRLSNWNKKQSKKRYDWDGTSIGLLILSIVFILLGIFAFVMGGVSFVIVSDKPWIACVILEIIGLIPFIGGIVNTTMIINGVKE